MTRRLSVEEETEVLSRAAMAPAPDARVRFTTSHLGLMEDVEGSRFAPEIAYEGDEGTYVGPHPFADLAEKDWHVVRVDGHGRELFAPVHRSHFELVA